MKGSNLRNEQLKVFYVRNQKPWMRSEELAEPETVCIR